MDKNLRYMIWLLKSYRGTKRSDDCTSITLRVPLQTIRERIPISEYTYYTREYHKLAVMWLVMINGLMGTEVVGRAYLTGKFVVEFFIVDK
jgi:hypothetical protein